MFGQLGLIVASADDRGREGAFESDTDVITTDDGSGSGGGGAAASSGGGGGSVVREVTTHAADTQNVRPLAGGGSKINVKFPAQDPTTYDHSTGAGGDSDDATEVELEAEDFRCLDKVVYYVILDAGTSLSGSNSLTVDAEWAKQTTSNDPFGFSSGVSFALETTGQYSGDLGESITGAFGSTSTNVTLSFTVTDIEAGETIPIRIVLVLGNCGPGTPHGNVHATVTQCTPADITAGCGNQTTPLKFTGHLPTITLIKDIVGTPTDQGKFDLRIAGVVVADDVGDGGSSGAQTVLAGTYTIDELAGTGTSLGNYSTSITCVEATAGAQAPVSATSTNLTVEVDEEWVCTFTNTVGEPDLSIAKTPADQTVPAGSQVVWTVTVTNDGNAAATDVDITDTLPAGFTFVSADPDICSGTTTVSCTFPGPIAGGGGTASVDITVQAPDSCGDFTNSVNFTGSTAPAATADVTLDQCAPDLSIAKTPADQTVPAGSQVVWTVTVTNDGNAAATDVDITDTLPAGFTFVSADPDICSGTTTVSCTFPGPIAGGGGTASVDITVQAPDSCGDFTNSVTFSTSTILANLGSIVTALPVTTATADVTLDQCAPSLTIAKTPATQTVAAGSQVVWTVTVTNNGNAPASNVSVTDTLPPGFTFVSANPAICTGTTTLTCVFPGPIASGGGTASVQITVQAPSTCGDFTNSVNFTGVESQPATASVTLTGCGGSPGSPSLTVTKTADAAVVQPGSPIGFTITVSNSGSAAASGVTLSDTIPAVQGVTWSINGGTGAAQCSLTGNSLSCNFGTLSAGTSRSVHIVSTATSSDSCGTFTNVAVANSSNAGTATGQATVEVACGPSIRIVKEANPDSGSPGEVITYTYRITNTGDVTLFDISVDDDIVGHICDIPELDPGKTVKCTADFTIPQNANIEITNVVVATGEDENGTEVSDEDEETILVILGTTVTPTPTITPPGGVAFTGTSTFLPLTGLALLLLTLGTGLLWWGRRRSSHERDVFDA